MSDAVLAWLRQAQQHGFIGTGDLLPHVEHARGFVSVLADAPAGLVVDLGSGGGLPALVILAETDRAMVLVESHGRRAELLAEAVQQLGPDRAEVVHDRAEQVATTHRSSAAVVTARAFASSGITAEIAAPFLQTGGWLVVSEPPGPPDSDRWPTEGLDALGMAAGPRIEGAVGSWQVVVQVRPAPERYPRRVGIAAKRPLF